MSIYHWNVCDIMSLLSSSDMMDDGEMLMLHCLPCLCLLSANDITPSLSPSYFCFLSFYAISCTCLQLLHTSLIVEWVEHQRCCLTKWRTTWISPNIDVISPSYFCFLPFYAISCTCLQLLHTSLIVEWVEHQRCCLTKWRTTWISPNIDVIKNTCLILQFRSIPWLYSVIYLSTHFVHEHDKWLRVEEKFKTLTVSDLPLYGTFWIYFIYCVLEAGHFNCCKSIHLLVRLLSCTDWNCHVIHICGKLSYRVSWWDKW